MHVYVVVAKNVQVVPGSMTVEVMYFKELASTETHHPVLSTSIAKLFTSKAEAFEMMRHLSLHFKMHANYDIELDVIHLEGA